MNTLILPKLKTFVWLLKREYWEHRGGFFWAPLITGGIAVFFGILGTVIGVAHSPHPEEASRVQKVTSSSSAAQVTS